MVKNIRKISIKMLKEIMDKGDGVKPYSRTKMASMLDVSVETYSRWMNDKGFTRSANTLKQIDKVVTKYYKAS